MAACPNKFGVFFVILLLAFHAGAFSGVETAGKEFRRWHTGKIRLYISAGFQVPDSKIPGPTISDALSRALSRWESVADVDFEIASSDHVSVSPPGPAGDGISLLTVEPTVENLLLFAGNRVNDAALTRLFLNDRSEIVEADIVLNPFVQFSLDGKAGTFDLELVLTHEIGHLLGLEHSVLPSSIMFGDISINGLLGALGREFRLSNEDAAKIRALYGAESVGSLCCSSIAGNIEGDFGKHSVFLVDSLTGSAQYSVIIDRNGSFAAGGLLHGNYDLIAAGRESGSVGFGDVRLGTVRIEHGEHKRFRARLKNTRADFGIRFVGIGGQLSVRPVVLKRGERHGLIVAGTNLRSDGLTFGTDSPYLSVVSSRDVSGEFDGSTDVIRIDLNVSRNTPSGDYSIYAENARNVRKYLFSVISIK